MLTQQDFNGIIERVRADHRELHQRVKHVRASLNALRAPIIPAEEAADIRLHIEELRDYLDGHFQREEEGGCLEIAVTRRPTLAHEMTVVERQHGPLMHQLHELIDQIPQDDAPLTVWLPTTVRYKTFMRDLLAHEAAEEKLLQLGLNEPIEF